MKNKTAIVTGANAGIGKHTSIELAKKGITVIMAVRNLKRGEVAKNEILRTQPNASLKVVTCDLSSFQSVRKFSETMHKTYDHIDILINNAGAFFLDYKETGDGFERQWQINHLSHFLLTQLLIDLLRKSSEARIINVSSASHFHSKINFEDPNLKGKYKGLTAYGQSKMANILFTNALAGRLNPAKITANSLHPGAIRTRIGSKHLNFFAKLAWLMSYFYRKSSEKGAKTPVYLATDPSIGGVTGTYFDDKKPKTPDSYAQEHQHQERLWELSLKQTGIDDRIT